MFVIRVERPGGPECMVPAEVPEPDISAGDLLVGVEAAGLNFIDVYQRCGLYEVPMPYVPGLEGAGRVLAVGDGVDRFAPGDRVAWAGVPGSYAQVACVPADRAVPVPDCIGTDEAAAVMLQGLTAHFLTTDAFALGDGHRCLVHAAAGGVGLLLVQMATMRGAQVVATAGSPEKRELARAAGADLVLPYQDETGRDFADLVEDVLGPRCLDVVYDGVGRATFARGLGLLRRRGLMVSFGNASGPVDPVAPLTLSQKGSLYLTRPVLWDYVATSEELRERASDLLGWVAEGMLDVLIGARLPLRDAAEAHRLLEGRRTTGKVLLVPPASGVS